MTYFVWQGDFSPFVVKAESPAVGKVANILPILAL
jgi:hypothetical protein